MGIDYVEYPDCHVGDEMERGNFDVGFRIEGPKLDGEPMIIESRAFQIHQMFRKLCMSKGVKPDIIFNTSGFSLCHKLCRQKKGLSIVVDLCFHRPCGNRYKSVTPGTVFHGIMNLYSVYKRKQAIACIKAKRQRSVGGWVRGFW